jgi:hypothetical protein
LADALAGAPRRQFDVGVRYNTMPINDVTTLADDGIAVTAYKLAVRFTEDADLPARYRRQSDPSGKVRKMKEDSDVEKRFRANVGAWRQVIETMHVKIETNLACRFISLCPQFLGTIYKVTDNKDFCDFVDYMVLRRDTEQCTSNELGRLALLSVAFQREVEKRIQA